MAMSGWWLKIGFTTLNTSRNSDRKLLSERSPLENSAKSTSISSARSRASASPSCRFPLHTNVRRPQRLDGHFFGQVAN